MLKHPNYIINQAIGHFKILVMTPLFFFYSLKLPAIPQYALINEDELTCRIFS